ncbi:MAG: hypothetical protein K5912_01095, partial [Alphaproteobacteria bacterium]|nr:hypothetical protein [Alphaproteobacteria bacterium]
MKKIILFLFVTLLSGVAYAEPQIEVLSDMDQSLYSQVFMLQDDERIAAAQKLESQIKDSLLMNEVLYQRYFSKSYHTKGV